MKDTAQSLASGDSEGAPMIGLLRSPARLLIAAARPAASYRGRITATLLLVGLSAGIWRLAFAGLTDGGVPLAAGDGSPRLLVSEFGLTQDTLWSLSGDDPDRREPIATVPHAPGYGTYGALAPDGRKVAYTALPPSLKNPSADSPAELWLLDLSTGKRRVLASDADLLITPVWAPDGRAVVFRRSYPVEDAAGRFELVRAALDGGESVLTEADAALFPVGFDAAGALLYTIVSPAGTGLGRVGPADTGPGLSAAQEQEPARLSADFTRDWRLSPDGRRLAFLAPQSSAGGMVFRAMVADLSGAEGPLRITVGALAEGPEQDFGPAWHPDGGLTLGRLGPGQTPGAAVRLETGGAETLTEPDSGFDVPIAWSPDGGLLAVRTFEGPSPLDPGRARLELVKVDGGRRTVDMPADIAVVGWLSDE